MEAIFVATWDGVFKISRSSAQGWQPVDHTLAGLEVNVLAVHPEQRGMVYAGTRGGGLYRSQGSAKNWQRMGEKILPDKIRAMALDPNDAQTIYVGTEPPALWRSEDGGRTWQELLAVSRLAKERRWTYPVPAIQPHIRCIAIAPSNSKKICLAAQVGGVLISDDAGQSWTDVGDPIDRDVHSVLFDPSDGSILYAATGGGENFPDPTPPPKGRPLYRSSDGGQSWHSLSDGMPRTYAVPVRVHPTKPQTLYLGVAEGPPPLWLNRPTRANGALMRSCNGGATWEQLTGGFPDPYESMVECIEFDPESPDHLFVGTGGEGARYIRLERGEIFHSVDAGDHWVKLPFELPIIYALAVQ